MRAAVVEGGRNRDRAGVIISNWMMERVVRAGLILASLVVAGCLVSVGLTDQAAGGDTVATPAPAIVIGFVGGFVGHENAVHSPVQVARRLRRDYSAGVYVQVFENRKREEAYKKIREILGGGRAGNLTADEKRGARIIVYGMSWGGSETVALARELKVQGIPVLLTIQVDSVAKIGENDEVIPANVAEAVNFYQTNGLLHGREKIRAENAARTRILGNFRYDYKTKSLACEGYPWWDRLLTKYHTEIECDPAVWGRVEALIREKLPVAEEKRGAAGSPD